MMVFCYAVMRVGASFPLFPSFLLLPGVLEIEGGVGLDPLEGGIWAGTEGRMGRGVGTARNLNVYEANFHAILGLSNRQ